MGQWANRLRALGALFGARIANATATLLIFVVVARSVSLSDAGLYALAWSLSYVLATLFEGGLSLLAIREVARNKSILGHFLGAMLRARLIGLPLVLALAVVIGLLVGLRDEALLVCLAAALAAYFQMTLQSARDLLVALDRFGLLAAVSIADSAARLVAVTIAIAGTHSVLVAFLAAALIAGASAITVSAVLARYTTREALSRGAHRWRATVRQALPFGIFVAISAMFFHLHVLVVSVLLPLSAVALLQAGMRLFFAAEYLPEAASRWAYPRLSRAAHESASTFAMLTNRFATWLTLSGTAVAAALALGAYELVPAVFGHEYFAAAPVVWVLALAVPARFLAHAYGMALSAADAQSPRLIAASFSLVLALAIEVPLTIMFGVGGAAGALVVAALTLTLSYHVMMFRRLSSRSSPWPSLSVLGFAVVGALVAAAIVPKP